MRRLPGHFPIVTAQVTALASRFTNVSRVIFGSAGRRPAERELITGPALNVAIRPFVSD